MRDVVVVSFPMSISRQEADETKARLQAELGADVHIVVVGGGANVAIHRDHPSFGPSEVPDR